MSECLEVCSVNVRGLKGPTLISKAKAICHHFVSTSQNIVCLLDTHLDEDTEDRISKHWPGKPFFAHSNSSSHTAGIAILTRNLQCDNFEFKPDPRGRFAFLRFKLQNISYLIVCVYAPSVSSSVRSKFFQRLHTKLFKFKKDGDNVLILGDFNCVEKPILDKSSGSSRDTSVKELRHLVSSLGLEDLWRVRNPDKREYTFFSESDKVSHSRIDRVYSPIDITTKFSKTSITPFAFSDHSSVEVSLILNSCDRGRSSWNFKQALLKDSGYCDQVNVFWRRWQTRS